MHRQQEMSQVTEDDVNEVKGDISTLRFELLDVFKNNGMDISSANKNSKGLILIHTPRKVAGVLRNDFSFSRTGSEDENLGAPVAKRFSRSVRGWSRG